jgi:sarcosine oxidase subunit alpha
MRVERQNAYPSAALDVFGATDFFFPRGMDHHTFFTGAPRPIHAVMQKIARQLAGLGRLPDERPLEIPRSRERRVAVVVVGAGPAGLAAATAAATAGREVLLLEQADAPGGSLLADPLDGPARAARLLAAARAAGVEVITGATALGYYPEDRADAALRPGLLAVATTDGIVLVAAERYVYATGSYDQIALFPDNARPGIISARALGRLLVSGGFVPGKRPVVLGAGPYARALGDALLALGANVTRVDGIEEEIVGVVGHKRVRAIEVASRSAPEKPARRIPCDLLAVGALPTPATELAREHGCAVKWEASLGGFHVTTYADGRSSVPGVFAAGDVAGFLGTEAAEQAGARVGRSAAR